MNAAQAAACTQAVATGPTSWLPGEVLDDSKALRNQFNFSARAAQTSSLQPKDKATSTEPPPTAAIRGTCRQCAIYDAYCRDQERLELQDRLAKQKSAAKGAQAKEVRAAAAEAVEAGGVMQSPELRAAAALLERMVNQNTHNEVAMDCAYWDDASDAFKPAEGSLLPLWKFTNERAKKKTVTTIAWSPKYDDLFAIGYGSYDFQRQTRGLVCLFSLSNPTYPEASFSTPAGVLSVHFHPQYPKLLAVGSYNGTVMVADMTRKEGCVVYEATVDTGMHSEPVWQVRWVATDGSKPMQFYSVATDGAVLLWSLGKSALEREVAMLLRPSPAQPATGTEASMHVGGCCFDFNQMNEDVYLVGTDEGVIHLCSKAYDGRYLRSYFGHDMALYSVKWNSMNEGVFLSAAADWTVRLWSSTDERPVVTFDMGSDVGDIAWAPCCSTIFATCTADGKVCVFDLSKSKNEPMCSQKVTSKARLTHIEFHPEQPLLLVGDDGGCVLSLKLSPNLRGPGRQIPVDKQKASIQQIIDMALKSRRA